MPEQFNHKIIMHIMLVYQVLLPKESDLMHQRNFFSLSRLPHVSNASKGCQN